MMNKKCGDKVRTLNSKFTGEVIPVNEWLKCMSKYVSSSTLSVYERIFLNDNGFPIRVDNKPECEERYCCGHKLQWMDTE